MSASITSFLTDAFAQTDDAVLIIDNTGFIVYANRAALNLLQIADKDVYKIDFYAYLTQLAKPERGTWQEASLDELLKTLPRNIGIEQGECTTAFYQLNALSFHNMEGGYRIFSLSAVKSERVTGCGADVTSFLAENDLAMIVRYLPDTTIIDANELFIKKVSQNCQDIIGKSFRPLLPEDSLKAVEKAVRNVTPDNPAFHSINKIYDAQGEVTWSHWFNHCTFDAAGQPSEYMAVGFDMSELQAFKRRFELVEDLAEIAYWSYRPHIDFMDYSPQFLTICGWGSEEKVNFGAFKNMVHPDDKALMERHMTGLLKYHIPFSEEFRLLPAGGNERYVQCIAEAEVDKTGKTRKIYGILQDNTDLKHMRNAVQDTQQSLAYSSSMATNLRRTIDEHCIVSITDTKGKIIYANDKFCRASGYTLRELIGQSHCLIKSGEHDRAFYREMWDTITAGKIWQGEICNQRKDGRLYWVHSTIVPFVDRDGKPFQFVSVRTDITAMKENEKALVTARDVAAAANRAKSRFLANTSHELRTPLNAILGFSELMREGIVGELPPAYKEYAENIYASGQRLLKAVEGVLDITSLEEGTFNINCEKISVRRLILEEIIPAMNDYIEPSNINLQVEIADGLPDIEADASRMIQALAAVVENACKFNHQEGTVCISARQHDPDYLDIKISDSGIGMTEDEIKLVMEPFNMADDSKSRNQEGLGVGLSLAKGIVDNHHGDLLLSSEPGVGTTVTLRLPVSCQCGAHAEHRRSA
ncbi:MAG: hypothetical protein CMF31_08485 [Kordiimonas sp.]|nr:hypothetical protein [Kordiimonas sp.]